MSRNCEECVWLYFLQEAVQVWSLVPKRNQFEVPKEASFNFDLTVADFLIIIVHNHTIEI